MTVESSEKVVLNETEDWRTIKCNEHKTYRFGSNRSNVWNHEWSEQFLEYEFNEWKESTLGYQSDHILHE